MQDRGFDEVMIVNPFDPGSQLQGAKYMQFYRVPQGYGYYGAPASYGYYPAPGYAGYGQYAPAQYGEQPAEYPSYGYAEAPESGYMPVAGYGAGYPQYAEYPQYAAYPDYSEYPDYLGYPYAEYPDVPGYAETNVPQDYAEYPVYTQNPPSAYSEYPDHSEVMGYADTQPEYPQYAENPEMVGWGEPTDQPFDGYVRARSAPYNPGCMLPTNVNGYGEMSGYSGYIPPATSNPTCNQFTGSATTPNVTDPFRPLF